METHYDNPQLISGMYREGQSSEDEALSLSGALMRNNTTFHCTINVVINGNNKTFHKTLVIFNSFWNELPPITKVERGNKFSNQSSTMLYIFGIHAI